jgi:hypothetical protein
MTLVDAVVEVAADGRVGLSNGRVDDKGTVSQECSARAGELQ